MWIFISFAILGIGATIAGLAIFNFNFSSVRGDIIALNTYDISEPSNLNRIDIALEHNISLNVEMHDGTYVIVKNATTGDVGKHAYGEALSIVVFNNGGVSLWRPNLVTLKIPASFDGTLNIVQERDGRVSLEDLSVGAINITSRSGNILFTNVVADSLEIYAYRDSDIRINSSRFYSVVIENARGNNRVELVGAAGDFTKTLIAERGNSSINGMRTITDTVGYGENVINLFAGRGNNRLYFVAP